MGEEKRKDEIKLESFKRNPDKFVNMDNLVCAIKVNEDGSVCHFVNLSHTKHFTYSLGKLMYELQNGLGYMDMLRRKEEKSEIITPEENKGTIIT